MREELEALVLEAHELMWELRFRRNEGARLARLYYRATARHARRNARLASYDQMRYESSIEARAW